MKKLFTLCLALVLALGLAACGKEKEPSDTQSVDLRAAYEAGIKQVQDELGDNAPVLLEERTEDGWVGYTPEYIQVTLPDCPACRQGALLDVRLTALRNEGMTGELFC